MFRKISTLIFLFSVLFLTETFSQSLPTYNHFYIHPYFYNPSYMAAKNYTEVSVIHRQQWAGLDGAPVFSQLSLIHPFNNKIATGLNLYNNKSGILTTTSGQLSFSYTIDLAPDTYFSFGISGGAGRNSINVDEIEDVSDPVFAGQLDKSFFFEGQVGVNFQMRNLNFGVSLPQLFKRSPMSPTDLQDVELDAFSTLISSASYKLELSPDIAFEPMIMYRMDEVNKSKLGGYGTLYLKQLFWVGGGYKQDYGASAYAGFQVTDRIQLGYSYEFGTTSIPELSNKTHEFRIAFNLGKRRVNRQHSTGRAKEEKEEEEVADAKEEEQTEEPIVEQPPIVAKNEAPVQADIQTKTEAQPVIKEEPKPERISPIVAETKTEPPVTKEVAPVVVETVPVPQREKVQEEQPPVEKPVVVAEKKKPAVERVVKATTSAHPGELKKGVYVIVGVFGVSANGKKYIEQLRTEGYEGNMGYYSGTKLNYVYVYGGESIEEARSRRDELREIEKFQFPNAWVLTIE